MFYKYFYCVQIPEEERKQGHISYATLAKAFPHILCNDLIEKTGWENWELENGSDLHYVDDDGNDYTSEEYDELPEEKQDECHEEHYDVYQYYIIGDEGASILKTETSELVWYNEDLNLYLWGVCHFGTPWNGVPTEIECGYSDEEKGGEN